MDQAALRRQAFPKRPRAVRFFSAAFLLFGAALLVACDLLAPAATPTPAAGVSSAAPGGIVSGGGFGGSTAGGSFGTNTGAVQAAATPTGAPDSTIGSLPIAAATPTAAAQIAAAAPASLAFAVGQDSLDVAGRLAYVGADNRIWTMKDDGSDWKVLLDKPTGDEPPGDRVVNLNVAPSGKSMLYTVLNADGSAPRTFLLDFNSGQVSHQKYNGSWSTDSTHVATSVDSKIVVYNVTSGQEETIGAGASPNWTADGHLIAFRDGNVWTLAYPANAADDRKLTNFPSSGADLWQFYGTPVYHYTGRVIFAGAQRSALDDNGNGVKIMSVDADGQMVALSDAGGSNVRYMQLSPAGTRLAYSMQTTRNGCVSYSTVQFVNATGGSAQTAAIPTADDDFAFLRGMAWAPDQKLVYAYTERTCASGSPVDKTGDRLYLVDPADPGNPRYIGDGAFPAFIRVWALGQAAPGEALRPGDLLALR